MESTIHQTPVKLCNAVFVDDSDFPSADHEVLENTPEDLFASLSVMTTEKLADLSSEQEGETGITPQE